MQDSSTNIYKIARLSAGLTQEAAAEQLFLSVESIKAYETGLRVPPSDAVVRMTERYGTKWLPLRHLTDVSEPLGVLPEVRVQELPTATLQLVNRMADFADRYRTLMKIAEDGVIDEDEEPIFRRLTDELNGIIQSALQVIYAEGIKKERPEAGTSKRSSSQTRTNCNFYYTTTDENCKPQIEGVSK